MKFTKIVKTTSANCVKTHQRFFCGFLINCAWMLPLAAEAHEEPAKSSTTATATASTTNTKQAAHEHGSVKLGVAFEGLKAEVMLEAPGESIFGFEHAARNDEERKTIVDTMKKLRNNPGVLFGFDSKAGCQFSNSDVHAAQENMLAESTAEHQHNSDAHASLIGRWYLNCKTSLSGSKLQLNLIKHFPRIEKIAVIQVSGDRQSARTLSKDEVLDL